MRDLGSRSTGIGCIPALVAVLTILTAVSAGQITVNPASISFGSVPVGSSQTQSASLTNPGGFNVTVSQATVNATGFTLNGLSLPLTLSAGQSAIFSVTFAPPSSSPDSGTISLVTAVPLHGKGHKNASTASTTLVTVSVSGTGIPAGQLAVAPSSVTFGSVQVGSSQSQSVALSNSGGMSITVSQATATGTGMSFSGLTLPVTLGAGQSTTFNATFAPQSAGNVNGNIAIVSDASNSTLNVALAGLGVTTGALAANPLSLTFGSVQLGSNQTQSETLTNSGGSSLTITQAAATGSGFSVSGLSLPLTLAAGQSATFSATFAPQSSGNANGSVSITSNASNPNLSISLSGAGATPGALGANPSSISFGSVQVGSSKTLFEAVTNSGGSSVTISQAAITGSAFTLSGLNLPMTLTAGQSVTFSLTFAPQSSTSASGSISIASNASNPTLSIPLSATGTAPGQLAASPAALSFGNVVVGTSQNQTGTLSASGASVTVSSAGITGAEFSLNGLALPLTLASGQTVSYTVTFTPQTSGTASANLSFVSNATTPTAESLSGNGTAPPQHSVDLSWNASTSTVVGYNVYRGTQSGGPYAKITSTLDASTTFTDTTVQAGQTYYYVTTAVDGSVKESSYSNQVQAVIPTP